ncbi:MAG TPA: glycogen-binding domain-containing protein [Tepidisphaeraceae bacterium]|nr:glycogen-binding domain-containing protein [Tepidisphaeraceae bacterium]
MICVFRLNCPPCRRVALAGTFNNWSTNANSMEQHGDQWETEVDLPPGDYEYCYFIFEDDTRPPKASVVNARRLRVPQGPPEKMYVN